MGSFKQPRVFDPPDLEIFGDPATVSNPRGLEVARGAFSQPNRDRGLRRVGR